MISHFIKLKRRMTPHVYGLVILSSTIRMKKHNLKYIFMFQNDGETSDLRKATLLINIDLK